MKRIQQKLMVTEEQANHIMELIKKIRERREDYCSCLKEALNDIGSYKYLTDAEIIIMSLNNQSFEERWNTINIVDYKEKINEQD